MKQVVIMPGGFHPFHAGHYALYQQAQQAFPGADVYVAATNDTSSRPFPFALKEKLAKLAGVDPGKFIQVKSPFRAMEIVGSMDPADTQLIFVRSQKDADKPPQAGGVKKDGQPAYLQLLKGQTELAPMAQHAYMAYLPTVEFGPGMTSATEIRTAWPTLNEKRKTALVMSLYPATQKNPKLAANVVAMLDTAIGGELEEGVFARKENPAIPVLSKLYRITAGLTPQNVEQYKQVIQSHLNELIRSMSPQVKPGVEVIEQGVAEGSLNEFVGNAKDFGGKPTIKARYQHGQDFVVSVNGDQYSFAVTNMEAQGENPVLFNIANHIMMDVNGDQPPRDIQQAVANYIDEYHQRDLAKVSAFHDKKYAQHPDYYHTTYQKPLQRVSDFVKKDPDQGLAEDYASEKK